MSVISALKADRGLALQDLLNGAYEYIDDLELKPHARIYLLDYLATTEYVTSVNCTRTIQLTVLPTGTACLLEQMRKFN